ncbi:glycosyltransferase [Planctomycetota bacterium]
MNTATREALPNSFLEACAPRCALVSGVNPDRFCSRFGYHAADGDFARGLRYLLENDRWKEKGKAAQEHMAGVFATDLAMRRHMDWYEKVLS